MPTYFWYIGHLQQFNMLYCDLKWRSRSRKLATHYGVPPLSKVSSWEVQEIDFKFCFLVIKIVQYLETNYMCLCYQINWPKRFSLLANHTTLVISQTGWRIPHKKYTKKIELTQKGQNRNNKKEKKVISFFRNQESSCTFNNMRGLNFTFYGIASSIRPIKSVSVSAQDGIIAFWETSTSSCLVFQQSPWGCARNSANLWLSTDHSQPWSTEFQPFSLSILLSISDQCCDTLTCPCSESSSSLWAPLPCQAADQMWRLLCLQWAPLPCQAADQMWRLLCLQVYLSIHSFWLWHAHGSRSTNPLQGYEL